MGLEGQHGSQTYGKVASVRYTLPKSSMMIIIFVTFILIFTEINYSTFFLFICNKVYRCTLPLVKFIKKNTVQDKLLEKHVIYNKCINIHSPWWNLLKKHNSRQTLRETCNNACSIFLTTLWRHGRLYCRVI